MIDGKTQAVAKMRAARVNPTAIAIFERYWDQLDHGDGMIPEDSIRPLTDIDQIDDSAETSGDRQALAATAVIKLNGGLGTSMGLERAKSLLVARDQHSFLDLIVRQVLWARQHYQVRLPLIFLHSAATQSDVLQALRAYRTLPVPGLPIDIMQSEEPKLWRDSRTPVDWPANRQLEWCPPGHGDLYPTLFHSGLVATLLTNGYRYAYVSNSDNLGAAPSARLAGWFARSQAPFATEVTPRTAMDVKGGHIAVRRSDGHLILRETAQTPPADQRYFNDAAIHPFAHCNTLWFNLAVLDTTLRRTRGQLDLPLIRNVKTVDPTDPSSPAVIQLESAMGAAIEHFPGALAVAVPRSRFIPVKTTNELCLLRSDVFDLGDDWIPRATVAPLPVIDLDRAHYSAITDFDHRLPHPLALRPAHHLVVEGDWTFGAKVQIAGDVRLPPPGGQIPDGAQLGDQGTA